MKQWTKNLLFLLFGVGLSASAAFAEPDDVTRKFMNAKPSLFDFGMVRLDLELQRIGGDLFWPEEFSPPWATYDWDSDEVRITAFSFNKFKQEGNAKLGCKNVFDKLRDNAMVNPKTGQLYDVGSKSNSLYADLFEHVGYRETIVKKDLSNLDKKFKLICEVAISGQNRIVGGAPLFSSKIYFEM